MNQLLTNPYMGFMALAAVVIVACTLIVFVTDYLRKSQQAAIDAYLKQDMLSRGMSAVDIRTVLEASSDSEAMRLRLGGSDGIRLGLGKFQLELGEFRKTASEMPESRARATS